MPYLMAVWAAIATCGPSFGPLLSSYSIPVEGWRWSQWEILWLAGPVTVLMFIALPETSTPTIMLHRARRLRHSTGNMNLKSQSEVNQVSISAKNMILDALMKPVSVLDDSKIPCIYFIKRKTKESCVVDGQVTSFSGAVTRKPFSKSLSSGRSIFRIQVIQS
ncbi:Caffeine resistance protein 5 [Lachnellula cervina]|uniref:Caffeine resistance protein 5 n=1 Tax=Lachnellula cervina TaxID=1316786 RepID=A0A7D8YWV7_9HELO|nr:Caffeine resistance protein 5 [Lachnellula cervina]